jgi:hypothetical protein
VPKDGSAVPTPHAFIGESADLMNITIPKGGSTDVDLGNVLVSSPYPASWITIMNTGGGYLAPLGCGTGNTPLQVSVANVIIDSTTTMFNTAANGIAPVLPPLLSPKISASATGPFVDAFQPQTGVSLTPTLQWVVQSSLPQPNYIRIFLYSMGVDSTNHVCTFVDGSGNSLGQNQVQIAQLFEAYQSSQPMTLTIPAGLLLAGRTYFAVIRAVYEPGRDVVNRPQIRGSAEYYAEVVTNTFAP